MRLTVHRLTAIPAQQQHYVDLIVVDHSLPSEADFYLATFNEKAVALAWRQQQQLQFIAVRDITRRRGVGKELVRQIKHDIAQKKLTPLTFCLSEVPKEQQPELAAFLTSQGFNLQEGVLSWKVD
ncbi:MAG: PanM family protein [Aeromonadales bacterium]|nr:PanM family protein [Aeromonadales bacterium]